MKTHSILFKNIDWIVTQNSEREILKNKSVYIEDKKIVEIGSPRVEADQIIDAKGKVLIPGMINSHTHSSMTLFRGYADDMELNPWLEKKIWPLEAKLTPKDCYIGSLLACLEMIRFGVTCFNDMYIYVDEIAKAVKKTELRCFLGEVIFDWNLGKQLPYSDRFTKKWLKDELVTPLVNMHAPYSCSDETLLKLKENSQKYDILMHMHVSETEKEVKDFQKTKGQTPVEHLEEIGILNDKLIAVHCNWLTDKDVDIFAKKNCSVVHCPISNMKLANGRMPPLRRMFKRGLRVGLGTDGSASNNNLDMFEEMKMCSLVNKFSERDPTFIPAQKALDLVTIEPARIFGIYGKVGSIEEGKIADLALVDFRKPHLQPVHGKDTIVSNLVYSCKGRDVDSTVVNGKLLMENRDILGIDEEKVFEDVWKISEKLG
jgi:5-methylthioadenosine/S-adenosylhomocysteine deaminase